MAKRPRPDFDQVRDAMRDRDERAETAEQEQPPEAAEKERPPEDKREDDESSDSG